MRQTIILLCACAVTGFSQTSIIKGTVVDDSGAPIQNAAVTASLWSSANPIPFVAGKPPAFMPVPSKALSDSQGEFEVDGLFAGQYYVCVEQRASAILNPCLWSDSPVSVTVADGATASGVSFVAAKGVALNIRVQDAKGLLQANPALDDVKVGTFHRVAPFIPGLVSGRDPAGKTMTVIVPRGQAATISVSSSAFVLADANGVTLTSTTIPLTSSAVANAGAGPVITVNVTSATVGH